MVAYLVSCGFSPRPRPSAGPRHQVSAGRLIALLVLLAYGPRSQAQNLVGIKLRKQPERTTVHYVQMGTSLVDSVLSRHRIPRAVKRGIVKEYAFKDFAGNRQRVLLLVGQNQQGSQIGVVTDENRNGDFRDDPLL